MLHTWCAERVTCCWRRTNARIVGRRAGQTNAFIPCSNTYWLNNLRAVRITITYTARAHCTKLHNTTQIQTCIRIGKSRFYTKQTVSIMPVRSDLRAGDSQTNQHEKYLLWKQKYLLRRARPKLANTLSYRILWLLVARLDTCFLFRFCVGEHFKSLWCVTNCHCHVS